MDSKFWESRADANEFFPLREDIHVGNFNPEFKECMLQTVRLRPWRAYILK